MEKYRAKGSMKKNVKWFNFPNICKASIIKTNYIHISIDQWNEKENPEKDVSMHENLIYDTYDILI